MNKTRLSPREYLVVASTLFGMFFGAGNLIFPVSMGQQAGSNFLLAAAGFCVTGVGLPLLGIASMGISDSRSLYHMSSRVSRPFGYFFTCALYLTIGPLFAIPRTATVSFQVGIAPMLSPEKQALSLFIFSLLFFAAVLFFSLRPSKILTWVGKMLNPAFLIFLTILIAMTLFRPMGDPSSVQPVQAYAEHSFFTGFLEGYNTMDALASLAFGIVLIESIRGLGVNEPTDISLCTIRSGIFSTLPMALIYLCLTLMGAQSVHILGMSPDGGTALYYIAHHYFGPVGGAFLGLMITFACLKTAIGLVTSCSRAFAEMFPKAASYRVYAIGFSLFSLAVSNVGLSSIIDYSIPVLMLLYPMIIVLIILCLFGRKIGYSRTVFLPTMTLTTLAAILDMYVSLPAALQTAIPFGNLLLGIRGALPLSGIGMGWVLPTLLGFAAGMTAMLLGRKKDN